MRELGNEKMRKWGNEEMRELGNEKISKWGNANNARNTDN